MGEGRRALRLVARAHRVPRHAAGRDARRRLGSAPVRLGRAVGRRRRPAPGRVLRVQPAAVPQRDPPRGRVDGRGDRHLEPDDRAARRAPTPARCGSTCPGGSSWRSAPSASTEPPPRPPASRYVRDQPIRSQPSAPYRLDGSVSARQRRWGRGSAGVSRRSTPARPARAGSARCARGRRRRPRRAGCRPRGSR